MYMNSFNLEDKAKFSDKIEPQTIVENGDRKIMLFALYDGQELPMHNAPADVAIFVLKGELDFNIENQIYTVKKDEMLLIPERKDHSLLAKKKSVFLVVRI